MRKKTVWKILAMVMALGMPLQVCAASAAAKEGADAAKPSAVTETSGAEDAPTGEQEEEMDVTATVPSASSQYYVEIPASLYLGNVSGTDDYEKEYQVKVSGVKKSGGQVTVSTPDTGELYRTAKSRSASTLLFSNTYGTRTYTEDAQTDAQIRISKEQIRNAAQGSYEGTAEFTITYSAGDQGEDPKPPVDPEEPSAVTAPVRLMQSYDISQESMCNRLFYPEAELTVNGDGTATVRLYCVSPIPAYADSGAPLTAMIVSGSKEDVSITGTTAKDYRLTVGADSFADEVLIESNAGGKEYGVYPGFIPEAGTYSSDSFTFTIPVSAIRNSSSGAIYVNAYVNAVMSSWQSFYLLFDVDDDFGKTEEIEYGAYTVSSPGLTGVSVSGLKAYAEEKKAGEYLFQVRYASSGEDADKLGMAACAELISASGVEGSTQYYSMLLSYENEDGTQQVTDTDGHVLDISIPLKQSGSQKAAVYRHHEAGRATGQLTELTAEPAKLRDNTWYWDRSKGILHIYASKFSVYAVHLSTAQTSGGASGGGSGSGGTSGGTDSDDGLENTSYTAKVSMRKASDLNSVSMCDTLFYDYADLEVNGSSTKMTLYVIDPIPKYASEGTPLSNISFRTSSGRVSASLSTSKVSRYFPADSTFIGSAGNYNSDPITVTLPTSALRSSGKGTVICQAYVNAVMKSTQEFYVVLSDWEEGETKSSGEAQTIDTENEAQALTTQTSESGSSVTTASSSSGVKTGVYQVPISALKEKSDDSSMMNDYMYRYAELAVTEKSAKLTVYIQHTVAGIESGGPRYISYQSANASKTEHAATFDGISYDSFTLTLSNPVPNILPVTMYINAMSMEVNARLVLDLNKMAATEGLDGGDGSTAEALSGSEGGTGTGNTGNAAAEALAGAGSGIRTAAMRLEAGSTLLKALLALIALGLLGLGGSAAYLRYRRR
ncbi:MAG: hypothetical protein Q4C82_02210 [Eubacteriales bacterium]|nr:hypothetical protein [Eubacteriales bacterium]